ncbi:MAG: hypothetical protein H7Y61_09845 [Rhizobiales bacterium]|nr:hypothetical protein [Rhizobacter sp.]
MRTEPASLITNRAEFHAALHHAFARIASVGAREVWLCDEDFSDWPLGERATIELLTQWAASSRKLTLLARHFDEVARRHPRWVEWRRNWAHIVSCRINTELATGEFPTVMLGLGAVSVRLADTVRHRGRLSDEKVDEIRCKEQIDAVSQRSEEAFPATTTGL